MASDMFDLPQPFGPTIAVTPGSKFSSVLLANDLNPNSSRLLKCKLAPSFKNKTTKMVSQSGSAKTILLSATQIVI
jgi:hypothetical protein